MTLPMTDDRFSTEIVVDDVLDIVDHDANITNDLHMENNPFDMDSDLDDLPNLNPSTNSTTQPQKLKLTVSLPNKNPIYLPIGYFN